MCHRKKQKAPGQVVTLVPTAWFGSARATVTLISYRAFIQYLSVSWYPRASPSPNWLTSILLIDHDHKHPTIVTEPIFPPTDKPTEAPSAVILTLHKTPWCTPVLHSRVHSIYIGLRLPGIPQELEQMGNKLTHIEHNVKNWSCLDR